jgi:hypothetical protein
MKTDFWRNPFFVAGLGIVLLICLPCAHATQQHGGREGLYVHQMSHIFLFASMGILIYWLRQRRLVRHIGWRYIQYAAIFFILWTSDAFLVHALDEQFMLIRTEKIGQWHIRINDAAGPLEIIYYIGKLDHLFCVPAMYFLYRGLKHLASESDMETQAEIRQ